MRTQRFFAIILAAGFLAVAVGAAMAQPGSDQNQTQERRDAAKARYEALAEARVAALTSFKENRSVILESYHAELNATRTEFLAAKTGVIEGCRADHPEMANETTEAREAYAKCVRDGLKPLIEQARADNAAAREKARTSLVELRTAKIGEFQKARENANARYGRPTDGA